MIPYDWEAFLHGCLFVRGLVWLYKTRSVTAYKLNLEPWLNSSPVEFHGTASHVPTLNF